MRPRALSLLPAVLGVIMLATSCSAVPDAAPRAGVPDAARRAAPDGSVTETFGKLPLRFEENRGQTAAGVDFLARGHGYTAFINPEEAVLSLTAEHAAVVRMRVVGADPDAAGSSEGPQAGVSNYLTGPRDRWITDVPNYPSVRYADAYPGIDLVYRGSERGLKYDFVVAPGADPDRIALAFDHGVKLDRSGDLLVDTPSGTLRHDKPFVYQEVAGRRRPVEARYVVGDSDEVGFALGRFDRNRPLVIDPAVVYSTYLGGPAGDQVAGIAVDSGGNAYVTGFTASPEFPVVNPHQPTKAGGTTGGAATDAYVAKFNPDGNGLVYSTFLGGSAADAANAIAVDAAGNAYVAGSTSSTNFPTVAPFQAAKGAGTTDDAFVAKLAPAGNTLIYSTYLGGAGVDSATGIAVDSTPIAAGGAGEAYVTGSTTSTNFPTATPFQPAKGAGTTADAFVTRFHQAGSAPVYSTYLGGGDADSAAGIALDGAGNAYVAGTTASTNFPLASPFQPTKGAESTDAFVTKLPPTGSAPSYSTYLGGRLADSGAGVAVDGTGAAYVTGSTMSPDFPTAAAFQSTRGTGVGTDAFVTKLAPSGATLAYSSYLGAGEADAGRAIAVDGTGSAHVAGHTQSDLFPLVRPLARRLGSTDVFVSRVSATGSSLVYSTHYGGIGQDEARAVAVDAAQNTYVGGFSAFAIEPDYFPTVNPYQGTYGGGFTAGAPGLSGDGFLTKIAPDVAGRPLVTGLTPTSGDVAGGTTVVISGSGLSGATGVRFGDVPARSFVVESDQRIVAVTPGGPAGSATVTVTTPQGTSPSNPIAHFFYGEGSWSLTAAMSTSRWSQTSTLLPNGKVLVVGGRQSHLGAALASAELYDPLTGTFQTTGSMAEARWLHSATLLPNGKVLVAGGLATSTAVLASAELYDPATGTWSSAGSMGTARQAHAAVLLGGPNCGAHCGKVLAIAGRPTSTTTVETAELYNPALNAWEATGSLAIARHTFGADLLGDGRVLAAGGFGAGATAEVYDPRTGAWLPTDNPMSADKARDTATRLADGNILVTSGWNNGPIPTADVFDFRTNRFRRVGDPVTSRWNHSAVLLPNGRVFTATGGVGGATAEIFDPVTNGYRFAGLSQVARGTSQGGSVGGSAVVLSSSTSGFEANPQVCGERCGKVLLLGNSEDPTAELYTPAPPADTGYWMVAADGGIFAFGNAPFHGSTGDIRLNQPVVGMAPTPSGNGYWMVASDGGIFAFGDAGFFGSTGDIRLSQPVVGMAPTPTGNGYWLVAADGGIFAFGDAAFFGSTGDIRLNRPVVGMAATPSGSGYWMVASDGGIFAFGDADFFGSTGDIRLNRPVVGMASTPSGSGYWMVASDGGIFAFGNAPFYGSTGDIRLNQPVVGMTSAPSGDGYWMVASDGGIFAFGNAPFHGSTGDIRLNQPMVGMSRAPRR